MDISSGSSVLALRHHVTVSTAKYERESHVRGKREKGTELNTQ
jgi:hypothetical protein